MKSPIEQEIEWCESHMGESANGIEFEKGFIAGLKQALRFEQAVEHRVQADEATPCAHRAPRVIGVGLFICDDCGKTLRR